MANKVIKKKITRESKERLLTIGIVSIFAFGYFSFTLFSYTYKIFDLSKKEIELNIRLDELKTQREELLIQIDKLQDPDYLARYAREKYYYTKDGEYVLKIEQDKLVANNSSISDTESKLKDVELMNTKYKYVISSGVILLTICFVIVIRKSRV